VSTPAQMKPNMQVDYETGIMWDLTDPAHPVQADVPVQAQVNALVLDVLGALEHAGERAGSWTGEQRLAQDIADMLPERVDAGGGIPAQEEWGSRVTGPNVQRVPPGKPGFTLFPKAAAERGTAAAVQSGANFVKELFNFMVMPMVTGRHVPQSTLTALATSPDWLIHDPLDEWATGMWRGPEGISISGSHYNRNVARAKQYEKQHPELCRVASDVAHTGVDILMLLGGIKTIPFLARQSKNIFALGMGVGGYFTGKAVRDIAGDSSPYVVNPPAPMGSTPTPVSVPLPEGKVSTPTPEVDDTPEPEVTSTPRPEEQLPLPLPEPVVPALAPSQVSTPSAMYETYFRDLVASIVSGVARGTAAEIADSTNLESQRKTVIHGGGGAAMFRGTVKKKKKKKKLTQAQERALSTSALGEER